MDGLDEKQLPIIGKQSETYENGIHYPSVKRVLEEALDP